jgi:hypothetical protein
VVFWADLCAARQPSANHGEDVKELYYYLDSTPTHSYMKFLYKYPQNEFPYEKLKQESAHRGRDVSEYELLDTDVFDEDRYWDVFVEYAKDEQHVDGISVRITAYNRGPDPADLHPPASLLPKHLVLAQRDAQGHARDAPVGRRRD